MVMEVVHEDMGEGTMQCVNHPYKNSTPGGICAFCLQEKLGNLVSSSFSVAVFPSSSSSPSPSFRSDIGSSRSTTTAGLGGGSALQLRHPAPSSTTDNQIGNNNCSYHGYYTRRSRLPFVLTQKKKKKDEVIGSADSASILFKRSKSTTTPRRGMHFLNENYAEDYSPRRRGFWSFLYMSKNSTAKKSGAHYKDLNVTSTTPSTVGSSSANRSMTKKVEDFVVVEENGSPSFDRKVSRSRSVGCGSRSFSGDFFERISTGLGDCTLRRVESHREGKPKLPPVHRNGTRNGQDCIKERVKCGGIFSGFMVTSSSSYLVSSSTEDDSSNVNGKPGYGTHSSMEHISHWRSKSWVWAFASPMRAFVKPSTGKRGHASTKNTTPDLNAIPSLLAVSS